MENSKPFDKAFVLKTTTRHIRRSIDISIRKSFSRLEQFKEEPEKKQELYETLRVLHDMRSTIDAFQLENADHFAYEHNDDRRN